MEIRLQSQGMKAIGF